MIEEHEEQPPMVSKKCNLQGRIGIKQLDRVGPYLVITNRWLYETGESRRYALVNEAERWVHSIHASQYAAVQFAQKQSQ
jgi:hypothetical protein